MTRIPHHLSLIGAILVLLGTTPVLLANAQDTGELIIVTAPVMLGDQILMVDALGGGSGNQSELVGFEPTTGEELWRIPLGPPDMPISPVAAGEAVFVMANSELLALETA